MNKNILLIFSVFLIISGLLFFSGCIEKQGLPSVSEGDIPSVVIKKIAAAGGKINYKQACLDIGADSMYSDTLVSLTDTDRSELLSLVQARPHIEKSLNFALGADETLKRDIKAYTINPPDTLFSRPVKLSVLLDEKSTEFSVYFSPHNSTQWEEAPFVVNKNQGVSKDSDPAGTRSVEITLHCSGRVFVYEYNNPAIAKPVEIVFLTPDYNSRPYKNVVPVKFNVSGESNEILLDLYSDTDSFGFDGKLIASGLDSKLGVYYWNVVNHSLDNVFFYARAYRADGKDSHERAWAYAPGSALIQTPDLVGPKIISVTHVDEVSTDFILPGDYTDFKFNEQISAYKLAEKSYLGVTQSDFASGSGYMKGSWADLVSIIGVFQETGDVQADDCTLSLIETGLTIRITLGGNITGDIEPSGIFSVNRNNLYDMSENPVQATPDLSSGGYLSDFIYAEGEWRDRTGPVIVSAKFADFDSPSSVASGDTFTIELSETIDFDYFKSKALTITGIEDNGFAPGSGFLRGSWNNLFFTLGDFSFRGTFMASPCELMVDSGLKIFTITLKGAMANTTNLPSGNFFPAARYLRDLGKNSLDESIYVPVTGAWRDITMPRLVNITYADSNTSYPDHLENPVFGLDLTDSYDSSIETVAPGDALVISFSEPMSSVFLMKLAGDLTDVINYALQPGSGYMEGSWLSIVSSLGDFERKGIFDASKVRLQLSASGKHIKITLVEGIINAHNRPEGQFFPIGIYLKDIAENPVLRSNSVVSSGAWDDKISPLLTEVIMVDGATPDFVATGDILRFKFNRQMSADLLKRMVGGVPGVFDNDFTAGSGFLGADFRTFISAFGSFSHSGNFQSDNALLSIDSDRRIIDIMIGSSIIGGDKLFTGQFSCLSKWLKDQAGNPVSGASVELTGSWSENNRPEAVSITLYDFGQAGPETGDKLEISYSEPVNYNSLWQIARDKQSVTNRGLLPGAGSMIGPFWDIMGSIGQFTIPGDLQASGTEMYLSQDAQTITFILGGTVAGSLSPAGHFFSSGGYVYDIAGNPVITDKYVAVSGDFGSLPSVSNLDTGHVTALDFAFDSSGTEAEQSVSGPDWSVSGADLLGTDSLGSLKIDLYLDIKTDYRGAVQFEFALLESSDTDPAGLWQAIDQTKIYPAPRNLERGSHKFAWESSHSITDAMIDKRAWLTIRARASREDLTHTGPYSLSPSIEIYDTRDFINMAGLININSENADPLDASGPAGDMVYTDSGQGSQITGIAGSSMMKCNDFYDVFSLSSFYFNAWEWAASKTDFGSQIVSVNALPLVPVHYLPGKVWNNEISSLSARVSVLDSAVPGTVKTGSVSFDFFSSLRVLPGGSVPNTYVQTQPPYLEFTFNAVHSGNAAAGIASSEANEFKSSFILSGDKGFLNILRADKKEYRAKN